MEKVDVIVIGAGIAGITTAITCKKTFQILLIRLSSLEVV